MRRRREPVIVREVRRAKAVERGDSRERRRARLTGSSPAVEVRKAERAGACHSTHGRSLLAHRIGAALRSSSKLVDAPALRERASLSVDGDDGTDVAGRRVERNEVDDPDWDVGGNVGGEGSSDRSLDRVGDFEMATAGNRELVGL